MALNATAAMYEMLCRIETWQLQPKQQLHIASCFNWQTVPDAIESCYHQADSQDASKGAHEHGNPHRISDLQVYACTYVKTAKYQQDVHVASRLNILHEPGTEKTAQQCLSAHAFGYGKRVVHSASHRHT